MNERTAPTSTGLLVLGMHRSGTSALAGLLGRCGLDLGTRVLGASAGNEAGHWEDAFAVDVHERLLDALGATWDQPFSVSGDWARHAPAADAIAAIAAYVRDDRRRHARWAVKDPRISLFAPAWLDAMAADGVQAAGILMLRAPSEVARSLAVRDGLGPMQALLLWLDYTVAAVQALRGRSHVLLTYDTLLADWQRVLARIAAMPGVGPLRPDAEAGMLPDPARRHHAVRDGESALPAAIRDVWALLRGAAADGAGVDAVAADVEQAGARARELVAPLLGERRRAERALWERTARAEASLAAGYAPDRIGADIEELRARVDSQHAAVVQAISGEIRHMQDEASSLRAIEAQRSAELQALREQSDARQREVVRLQAECSELRERARLLDVILASHSWRITRPLRAARRLLTGRAGDSDRAQLGRRARDVLGRLPLSGGLGRRLMKATLAPGVDERHTLPTQALASLIDLAPQADGVADVFVWAVIDWRFRTQRPQHLARALAAKGHRVFYISNNFIDSASAGFSIDPLDGQGRLFQIHLHLDGAPAIYFETPTAGQVEALRASVAALLAWSRTRSSVSLVQHPYWTPLVRAVPNARVVYDCMDHHAGFSENAPAILDAERRLLTGADLVIVTSDWLAEEVGPLARDVALIRNAGEYAFFSRRPDDVFRDDAGRRVLGYYGAIAEWFDVELVRAVALAEPDALVLLVGNDTAGVGARLADLPNVRMIGEVPYEALPYWLYAFDVCLLPFRVTPLTLATNPVKAYEYLAAGKPVVSVELPEMRQFGDLVATATDVEGFVAAVRSALDADPPGLAARRRAFAQAQTWDHRAMALDAALASIREPRVSVVVLTYNGLALTQACLDSIERHSDYGDLEVIVVDNLSTDGSREWLAEWAREPSPAGHARRLVLNDANLGFSAGNNVGLRAATGDFLVLLNNDTYVTPGWVRTLCAHLRSDPGLGLVGPVTRNIGNEARIDVEYADMADMVERVAHYTRAHPGATYPLRTAAFFCVAMPRSTYERVGDMDETFGVGFFEDDDYCRRVEAAGLRIACAEDVFVHHHLSASFDVLKAEARQALFERNRALYEAKWGPWVPHAYRPQGS